MTQEAYTHLIDLITQDSQPLSNQPNKFDDLIDKIGDSRFVLIGEATHGTEEFYQARIELTQQLIKKKGFMAIAIEGDWPDAYQIHRYIQGTGSKENSEIALNGFERFPTWMWRNTSVLQFIKWLRTYNDNLSSLDNKISFYGLDLYSLYTSMQAVIDYLSQVDAQAAKQARLRYACFDHVKVDPQTYGYLTSLGIKKSCVKEAIEQLLELQHNAFEYVKRDGVAGEDAYFYAMQNARLVKNAETYYRSIFEGHILSWNVRDEHMFETFNTLSDHLEKRFNKPAKIIIWAHNSHVGDARATEMGAQGEVNIGQLIREQHGTDTYLIGFSTYQGSVIAANDWDAPAENMPVVPAAQGSYEDLFHHAKHGNFILNLRTSDQLEHYLHLPRLQRAIGVIYRPETERESHYYVTRLPYQFDSIIHIDKTTALKPL